MDISSEIKTQIEIAIQIQKEILEDMQRNNPTNKLDGNRLKNINLIFDNYLKAKEVANLYLGEIEAEQFVSGDCEDDDCIY